MPERNGEGGRISVGVSLRLKKASEHTPMVLPGLSVVCLSAV